MQILLLTKSKCYNQMKGKENAIDLKLEFEHEPEC